MRIKRDPLDKLLREYLLLRDDYTCQWCGRQYSQDDNLMGLHVSHFKGRRKKSVRYDEENTCLLCFGCHNHVHDNPEEHTDFFKKRLGSDAFDALILRANRPLPMTKSVKQEIKKELEEKIRRLR